MIQFDGKDLQNYISNLSSTQKYNLKEFIHHKTSLIDAHDFDELYTDIGYNYGFNSDLPQAALTASLLLSDVNPLSYINEIPAGCFVSLPITSIVIPDNITRIGIAAFKNCKNLTSVIIPDSVRSMGDTAFQGCTGLTEITLPEHITSIGYFAFQNCGSLKNITIPKSVAYFLEYTFEGCKNLTSINYTGTKQDWMNTNKDRYWRSGSPIEKIICSDGEVKLKKL